jgi:hypothetical protein
MIIVGSTIITVFVHASELLYLNCETATMADLFAMARRREDVMVLLVFPPLPHTFSSLPTELLEALLELLVLQFPLVLHSPVPLGVECFWRPPLLPGKLFDLIPAEEHHVGVCRLVGVRF